MGGGRLITEPGFSRKPGLPLLAPPSADSSLLAAPSSPHDASRRQSRLLHQDSSIAEDAFGSAPPAE